MNFFVIITSIVFLSGAFSIDESSAQSVQQNTIPYATFPSKFTPSAEIVSARYNQESASRSGIMNGLKSLLFGPRIGLEANESVPISFIEKANLFVPLAPFQAYSENGIKEFLTSAFIGPRVGMEIKEQKIRRKEKIGLLIMAGITYHLMTSNPSSSGV